MLFQVSNMDSPPNFEVVVGTYEEYLLGYKFTNIKQNMEMVQSFATHGHTSSVRCVASAGKYLASGGADDRIVVYDMNSRKEHCMLNHHTATVTCVKFTIEKSHLLSGSNDGVLAIVRVGNWQLEKIWEKPHKGAALIDIAVHPTGKLALTLGSDYTLRTWNLIKGRQAYAINLTTKSTDVKSLDSIKWSPGGDHFVLSGGLHLELWDITTGGIVNKYQFKSRVVCTCPLEDKIIAIGHENGEITILNIENNTQKAITAHSMRVKCLESSENWLVSASSDGRIKVWLFDGKSLTEKGSCSTGCRCTSLALVLPVTIKEEIAMEKNVDTTEDEKLVLFSDTSDDEVEVVKNKIDKKRVKIKEEKAIQKTVDATESEKCVTLADDKVKVVKNKIKKKKKIKESEKVIAAENEVNLVKNKIEKKNSREVVNKEIADHTVDQKGKKRKIKTKEKKDKKIKNK